MNEPAHITGRRDRRLTLRVKPELHVPVRVDLNGENFVDIFRAADISRGGLGLQVPHRFEGCRTDLMVNCLVKLPAPLNSSVRAQGQIIHVSGDRFGLAFHHLSEKDERAIADYLGYRLKQLSWLSWAAYRAGFDRLSARLLNVRRQVR